MPIFLVSIASFIYNLSLAYLSGFLIYFLTIELVKYSKKEKHKKLIQTYIYEIYIIANNLEHAFLWTSNVAYEENLSKESYKNKIVANLPLDLLESSRKPRIKYTTFESWFQAFEYCQNNTDSILAIYSRLDELLDHDTYICLMEIRASYTALLETLESLYKNSDKPTQGKHVLETPVGGFLKSLERLESLHPKLKTNKPVDTS